MKKRTSKSLSLFFIICLVLTALITTFVVVNRGTGGFMTRAEGQSKPGGNIGGDPKPANTTTKSSDQSAEGQSKPGGNIGGDPKPANTTTKSSYRSNVQKMANPIKTSTYQSYVPIGWSFQKGFPVTQSATTKIPECPISPDVTEIGNIKAYANGVGFYIIKLCKVHGYSINSIKAKDFDNMFAAMKAAGYGFKGKQDNFRSYETQQGMHKRNPTGAAAPGGSNHERGLAVDISCFNASGGRQAFKPWMFGKKRGLADFEKAMAEHPCLAWIHNNAPRYRLLLMCDGKGDYGEIAVKTGGCETWHLSPTGH